MVIAIDFDGTIVTHEYPLLGTELPLAIDTMKLLQEKGHQLILYTMRDGPQLTEAIEFCKSKGITFWGINQNPTQYKWNHSRKIYAHLYIDDCALGCPLTKSNLKHQSVDWEKVIEILKLKGCL